MLKSLKLRNVGPSDLMEMTPIAKRFNIITGDNGLGKSFLLEVAWWALTRTWHETEAVPTAPDARIDFAFDGDKAPVKSSSNWEPASRSWKRTKGRPPNPGLVLYARVDGSFSVWDPARNYRLYKRADGTDLEAPAAYQFSASQVFHGLRREIRDSGREREQVICSGLIADWTLWHRTKDPNFELLEKLLAALGPEGEPLRSGGIHYPTPDDDRGIPTVSMPYGQEVPITYAPAGVQRMCKLAYLLAWALSAHKRESDAMGKPMSRQVILLIDEPETHLHPRWQRTVLPSIYRAIRDWHTDGPPQTQFLVATHSPLVLASLEPEFKEGTDALWKLDLLNGRVILELDDWEKRGDASDWLTSDVFDMSSARSVEAEAALNEAARILASETVDGEEAMRVHRKLAALLPAIDPFWARWRYIGERKGWLKPAGAR